MPTGDVHEFTTEIVCDRQLVHEDMRLFVRRRCAANVLHSLTVGIRQYRVASVKEVGFELAAGSEVAFSRWLEEVARIGWHHWHGFLLYAAQPYFLRGVLSVKSKNKLLMMRFQGSGAEAELVGWIDRPGFQRFQHLFLEMSRDTASFRLSPTQWQKSSDP